MSIARKPNTVLCFSIFAFIPRTSYLVLTVILLPKTSTYWIAEQSKIILLCSISNVYETNDVSGK